MSAAVPAIKPFVPTRWQIFISIVLVIFLASAYGFIFIDALDGNFHTTVKEKNLGGTIVWGGLTFWYVWKTLNRKGWIGALVGVCISVLVVFLGAAISGYVKAQRADILDQIPPLAALKRNFPDIADQVRQELRAISKDESQKRQQLLAIFQTRVFPVVYASMKTTSDAAVLQYTKVKLQQFREVGNANASDCVSLMLGQLEAAPPATQERITANTSKETRQAMQEAFVKILNDADVFRHAPPGPDETRFKTLFEQLDNKLLTAHSTSAYYFGDDSLNKPAEVRCKAGLLLFEEALNLPEKDRAFMLRALFTGDSAAAAKPQAPNATQSISPLGKGGDPNVSIRKSHAESVVKSPPKVIVDSKTNELAQFRLDLIAATKRYRRYPQSAIENGWQGRVEVRMVIDADGKTFRGAIKTSSGYEILDNQALDWTKKAMTLVPIPSGLQGRELVVDVPLVFSLENPNS